LIKILLYLPFEAIKVIKKSPHYSSLGAIEKKYFIGENYEAEKYF
jgi:hypothetical protein